MTVPYSTLEVAIPVSRTPTRPCYSFHSVTLRGQILTRVQREDQTGKLAPEVVHDRPDKIWVPQDDGPEHLYAPSPEPPKAPIPRRSNTRKKWLIIVAIVVFVCALAGGLAGGLLSRNRSGASNTDDATADNATTSTPTNATTPSSTGPLALSQLASLNWTDSSQVLRRAVFYQYDDALFLSQYHQSNESWTAHNISDVFEREGISINAKQGTPLATAATSIDDINAGLTDFTATLFYIDTDNYIQELVCNDEDLLSSWSLGDLQNHNIKAAENSNLAALAYFCPNDGKAYLCNNQFTIMYQAEDQNIMFVGATAWEPSKLAAGWPGGGVAMYPFASDDGTNITDVSEIRFYYQTNTIIELSIQNYLGRSEGLYPVSCLEFLI